VVVSECHRNMVTMGILCRISVDNNSFVIFGADIDIQDGVRDAV